MLDLGKFLNNICLFKWNNSGSTCVSLMTYGRKIFMANVGDSRAILIRFAAECKWLFEC
jgi:serine/threonine protein phosphatase PrpC